MLTGHGWGRGGGGRGFGVWGDESTATNTVADGLMVAELGQDEGRRRFGEDE